jgi:hypothetical protein
MLNTLTKFEKFLQEHEVIRANLRQLENSAENLATIYRLQDRAGQFTSYQINILSEKRLTLKRAVNSLMDGLIAHHQREEEAIKSLVGEPLMQIINREHLRVVEKLGEIDWMLLNIGPTGILFNIDFLKQKVEELGRILNAISLREDAVLDLLIKISEN